MISSIWEMSPWGIIKAGGPIMYPILLCSIFSLGFIIEKLIYFTNIKTDISLLKKRVFDLVKGNKIKDAIDICDNSRSPVARILKAGVMRYGHSREEIKESMEDASLFEIPKLESHLSALATIAHISPLLGLLGTVTGLTSCFYTLLVKANSFAPVSPGDLAGGIAEALLTTVFGLTVAIPTFIFYNFFVSRINHNVIDMERGATELLTLLKQTEETRY